MKKLFPIILFLSLILAFTACTSQEPIPQIPELQYEASSRSYRVAEQYNPILFSVSNVMDYESSYAVYHFDAAMESAERDTCVFYSDLILSHMKMEQKPELFIIDDYEGAWIGKGLYYIGGGNFSSADFAAKLITLFCGEYTNYGAAYGFAAYILGQEPGKLPELTYSEARDLNWLCFREEFVPAEEITLNKLAAHSFACEYISLNGEAAYVQLLKQSADPGTVASFNTALSDWYSRHGLNYVPSEMLYGIGGEHHDYLVKHTYATMYMAKNWQNARRSGLVRNELFLHESYETVKSYFELTAVQMETLQNAVGFAKEYDPVTVEFLAERSISMCLPYEAKLQIDSVEDFCHEYSHYLTTPFIRHQSLQYKWLDEGMTEYFAITCPNLYWYDYLEYGKENGLQEQASITGDWNELYKTATKDMTDPLDLWHTRWDLYPYYFDDYDRNSYGSISFTAYLIDTLGFDAVYNFAYNTNAEPPEVDLSVHYNDWVAYLHETYGKYAQYSDYLANNCSIEQD